MSLPATLTRRDFARVKFQWIRAVASDNRLSSQSCRVAALLIDFFRWPHCTARPAHGTLARIAKISARTVGTAIRSLEAAGYLVVRRQAGRSVNHYRLNIPSASPSGFSPTLSTPQFADDLGGRFRTKLEESSFRQFLEPIPTPLPPGKILASQSPEVREEIRLGTKELLSTLKSISKASGAAHA